MSTFKIPTLKIKAADGPIGAEITGADVSMPLDDADFQTIDDAIDRYAVVVIRDQDLTATALADFSRRFGRPQKGAPPAEGRPGPESEGGAPRLHHHEAPKGVFFPTGLAAAPGGGAGAAATEWARMS